MRAQRENVTSLPLKATGLEAIYRNPRHGENGVVNYLETQHGCLLLASLILPCCKFVPLCPACTGNHYRVYNLCAEKKYQYDKSVFNGNLSAYPFLDHNPAPLIVVVSMVLCLRCVLVPPEITSALLAAKHAHTRQLCLRRLISLRTRLPLSWTTPKMLP